MFDKKPKEPVKKNIESGEGFHVVYEGKDIRVLQIAWGIEGFNHHYDELEEHLLNGFTIVTEPISISGYRQTEVQIILKKPVKLQSPKGVNQE